MNVSCSSLKLHILQCNYRVIPLEETSSCRVTYISCSKFNTIIIQYYYCDVTLVTGMMKPSEFYIGQLRLYNGSYRSQGLLQVYLNGEWGTVCLSTDYFTEEIANIACRQLGYTNVAKFGRYDWY